MSNGNRLTMKDQREHIERLNREIGELNTEVRQAQNRAVIAESAKEAADSKIQTLRDELNRLKGWQERQRELDSHQTHSDAL